MQSLVVSAFRGTYRHHPCVLNTAGNPKRYITINLQEIVKLCSLCSTNNHVCFYNTATNRVESVLSTNPLPFA